MKKPILRLIAPLLLPLPGATASISVDIDAGVLRGSTGSPIANTTTLWALIYDENGDGILPGNLGSDESLVPGDAAATFSAFAGKTIEDDAMITGDRVIAVGEFNDPDAIAFANLSVADFPGSGLVSGRIYGFYWFPGRTQASNQLPASGDFPVGGINEVTNYTGNAGTVIPNDGANVSTGVLDTSLGGPLPASRFNAIDASSPNFATWISGFPAVGAEDGFDDDPDADGLDNGVESALGTRPDTPNQGITVLSTAGALSVRSSKAKPALADVTATWQWSDNLADWYDGGASNGSATVTIDETVTDPSDPDFDVTQVDAEVTVGALDRLFLRLSASQNP